MLGLRLVTASGERPSLSVALGRFVVMIFAWFFGLTWWAVLLRKDHRSLHDAAAGTFVVLADAQARSMSGIAPSQGAAGGALGFQAVRPMSGSDQVELSSPYPVTSDWLSQLERLALLRDQGAISGREYDAEKRRILLTREQGQHSTINAPVPSYGLARQIAYPPAAVRLGAGLLVASVLIAGLLLVANRAVDTPVTVRVPTVVSVPTVVVSDRSRTDASQGRTPPTVSLPPTVYAPSPIVVPTAVRTTVAPLPTAVPPAATTRAFPTPGFGRWVALRGIDSCLRVRATPVDGRVFNCLPDGAIVQITDGPVLAGGYSWWRISLGGWIAELSPFAPAIGPAPPSRMTPVETVRQFYTLLSRGQYGAAYQWLSSDLQRTGPFDSWLDGYKTTESITVESVRPTTSLSVVEVSLIAVDTTSTGQLRRRYSGQIDMVQEAGGWRLGRSRVRAELLP